MNIFKTTIGDIAGAVGLWFRKRQDDYFELPDLCPWKGRRAQVYPIIAACWRAGIHNYKAIQQQVKLQTGVACSRATIADWKREHLPKPKPEEPYPTTPPPPSPRTGTEKPVKPYKPEPKGIFRQGVGLEW